MVFAGNNVTFDIYCKRFFVYFIAFFFFFLISDEIQELKNDISSFHYDMKNRYDILEQSQQKLLHLMQKLNESNLPLVHER